jgi:hypothetical protein
MSWVGRVLLQAWITGVWLAVLFPITVPIVLLTWALIRSASGRGQRSETLRQAAVLAPICAPLALVATGGVFATVRTQPPPHHPWPVYVVGLLFTLQVGLAILAVARAPSPRRGVAGLMVAALWVGLVAAWLAWWAIEAGGTMGAL